MNVRIFYIGDIYEHWRENQRIASEDQHDKGELANDICTQSFISRLEGGSVSPSAETVYRLSERLGVPISVLIHPAYNERYDYFSEVYKQLRNASAARDYDQVLKLIQTQKNNPLFKDIRYQKRP
ncbi:helix-turn-helix transcriptional regulator [Bacillus sp. NTK074B]|uniref:helix-turn-helix domain-containing protein n=1 Tax=Bacillus sp. NTK074B TaxID=2802174 RepID=UPI001A8E74F2|nr:helix-turn-helix transcriptional regulator [Bacillus sp. NTK074B]